jgi:cell division protein FtsI/penicillin-binding protein 2
LEFAVALLLSMSVVAQVPEAEEDEGFEVPNRLTDPPLSTAKPLPPELDLRASWRVADGGYAVGDKRLTIEPRLQKDLTDILKLYETPWSAVVAIEPSTGRVLAMAEHSEEQPGANGLCTRALYPAASIFKIVTAASLLQEGVAPDTEVCFHGGKRKITEELLKESDKDGRCETMASALAHSANVAFAKLTLKYLDAPRLTRTAQAFRFNQPLAACPPGERSLASFPTEPLGLARTGAGFGDVWLSPMHGAALAATIANHGLWKEPVLYEGEAGKSERVMSEANADALAQMMALTVEEGTARRIFHERGYKIPGAVGKTGSLADKKPFRDYTWFVGYAPKDDPKVAVAALVVNGPRWRIRATWLGREAMRLAMGGKPFVPFTPAAPTLARGSVAASAPDAGTP